MAENQHDDFNIVIIGAGPSGLLLALLLAKNGIKATVIEKSDEIDKQPRASFYSYPAKYEFRRAGIDQDVNAKAFHASGVSWRYIDGTYICGIPSDGVPEELKPVSLPLDELLPLIASHLDKYSKGQILLGHEVTATGQDEKSAWVDVKTPDGEKRFSAAYIVGCDGGNSKIRRELFGSRSFPGKTWDKQIVATNVSSVFSSWHNLRCYILHARNITETCACNCWQAGVPFVPYIRTMKSPHRALDDNLENRCIIHD